jgi:hypothetical protein
MYEPDKVYAQLTASGNEWADANALAASLEETKKSLLNQLAQEFFIGHQATSFVQAESMALASKQYRVHIEGMVEARRIANRARVKYEGVKAWIELVRTQESTRRAEANLAR